MITQQTLTYSKLTTETLEKVKNKFKVNNRHQTNVNDVFYRVQLQSLAVCYLSVAPEHFLLI